MINLWKAVPVRKVLRTIFGDSVCGWVALIVSIWAVKVASDANNVASLTSHLHVTPNLIGVVKQRASDDKTNGTTLHGLDLFNKGPLKVVSVSRIHQMFGFDTNGAVYVVAPKWYNSESKFLLKPELPVGEWTGEIGLLSQMRIDDRKVPTIHVYFVSYFRESDMAEFKQKFIYFNQAGNVLDHAAFTKHAEYSNMLVRVRSFSDPEHGEHNPKLMMDYSQ